MRDLRLENRNTNNEIRMELVNSLFDIRYSLFDIHKKSGIRRIFFVELVKLKYIIQILFAYNSHYLNRIVINSVVNTIDATDTPPVTFFDVIN